ncbi:uncharacterized protein DEA37_0003351 [Paragonimus westermani]|uniref:Cadherin domain-containing protein n=1 Tax=Paragonimus westermani TaxID=34504 RepID=A0A5J4NH29_9TREM|nr:uncharacterized protein DEA37_0003351 [Paragonimus westermani]
MSGTDNMCSGGVVFLITHNTIDMLRLDSRTGAIRVSAAGLDRERRAFYKFVVTISDGQAVAGQAALPLTEQHQVHTIVHIEVEDENDNAPRIIYPETRIALFKALKLANLLMSLWLELLFVIFMKSSAAQSDPRISATISVFRFVAVAG